MVFVVYSPKNIILGGGGGGGHFVRNGEINLRMVKSNSNQNFLYGLVFKCNNEPLLAPVGMRQDIMGLNEEVSENTVCPTSQKMIFIFF